MNNADNFRREYSWWWFDHITNRKNYKPDLWPFAICEDTPCFDKQFLNMININKDYEYIYKFEMQIKSGFHSFGIGFITSQIVDDTPDADEGDDDDDDSHVIYGEHEHKMLYCILIENHSESVQALKKPICIKDPYHWKKSGIYGYYRCTYNRYKYHESNTRNLKKNQINPTLCIALNYNQNEIIVYYNDDKVHTFNIKDLSNSEPIDYIPFQPTFCIIPKEPIQQAYGYGHYGDEDEDDNKGSDILKEETSTFEIISCHLNRVERDHLTFKPHIIDIQIKNGVCVKGRFRQYGEEYREHQLDNCLSLKALGTELIECVDSQRNPYCSLIHKDNGQLFFDELQYGYYINVINLNHFNDSFGKLIQTGLDLLQDAESEMENVKQKIEDEGDDYRWDNRDFIEQTRDRLNHIQALLCNLWVFTEMYQHFRNKQKGLIFNALFQENKFFKDNLTISKSVTTIIIDMLLQNFDVDYEKYIQNNEDFGKIMSKIYITNIRWMDHDYDTPRHIFVYSHDWMDEHVIPKLNLPKDWLMIEEVEHTYAPFGRYPVHKWRYDYVSKDTIQYNPGFDEWSTYYKGSHQTDFAENIFHFSKAVLKSLIVGYIRDIYQEFDNVNSGSLLVSLCIDYSYLAIPPCFSWTSGWFSNSINVKNQKHEKSDITNPINIDCKTGVVTVKARDNNYEQRWDSPLIDSKSYPDMRADKMEIIEGMWTWSRVCTENLGDKLYHRLEIRCIENIYNFGIGIKTPWYMLLICVDVSENVLNVTEERGLKENKKDEMRKIIKSVKLDDSDNVTLSIDVTYPERLDTDGTFYLNGKEIYSCSFGCGARYTGEYYHPIFVFDTDKSRKQVSQFQISACLHYYDDYLLYNYFGGIYMPRFNL